MELSQEEREQRIREIKQRKRFSDDPYHIALPVQVLLRQNNRFDEGKKKYVWVASLNNNKKLIDIELVYDCDTEVFDINIGNVFRIPIRADAANIIWLTNHIDDSLAPTDFDKDTLRKILDVSNLINIPMLDYLIINETGYYSYKEAGLL